MDLAELGIIFVAEGADAAIAKMEEFREASAEVVETEEERVKSAGKLATATSSLSDQITKSIIAYSGSKSAAYEFQAIAMGVNDQLTEQIELLKSLEQMEKLAISTAKELAAEEKAGAAAAKQAAADAEKAERAKWDAIIATAEARARDIKLYTQQEAERVALAKKTEQDIADAKNKALLQTMNERQRMIDLYTKQEKERVAEAEKTAVALAAADKKEADNALKQAEAKALGEMAWAKKSRDEQIRIKDEIASYKVAGISDGTISNTFGPAAVTGVVKEVESLASKWDHVTLNTSRARSEMVVLAHEAVQGRFSRIPASLMVFAEYTDITALAMSGLGLAAMGAAAAIVVLGIAMVKGMLDQREMQNALILTGNYAGASEAQIHDFAYAVTAAGGSIGTAKEVLLQLTATGKFAFDQIKQITEAVVKMEDATGGGSEMVGKLVGEFKSLAVEANAHSRYSDEVSKAVMKLDNEYHFLTASVFAQIRAFEAEGQTKQASILATEEFAKVVKNRSEEIYNNLGNIEKGWRHVKEAIGGAWEAMKNWGRTEDITSKIKDATSALAEFNKPIPAAAIFLSPNGDVANQRAEATTRLLKLQQELYRQQENIDMQSKNSRILNEANNATSQVTLAAQQMKADKLGLLATKQEEYNAQLERQRAGLALDKAAGRDTTALEGLLTDDYITKYREGLVKLYGEKTKAAKEYDTTALNALIAAQNKEFGEVVKHTNNQISELDRKYTTAVKLENDRFSVVRANATAESELGFASANEYIGHYEAVAKVARESLAIKLGLLDEEERAGDRRTVAILAELNKQVTATAKGEEVKQAAIKKATADQLALHKDLQDQKVKASNKADSDIAQAFSETMKLQNADIEKQIGMQEKKNAKIEEEIFALTHTKQEVELLREANERAYTEKLAQSIRVAELQRIELVNLLESQTLTDKEYIDAVAKVALLDQQIDKSKVLLKLKEDYKQLLLDKAEAQAESARIKAVEDEWKKSWDATNKFAQDAFVTWGQGGGDAAKKIGNMLEKALLEAIYSATLKPILFKLYTSFMGDGGSAGQKVIDGMTGDGGGGGGDLISSLISSGANKLFGNITIAGSSIAAIGSSVMTGIQAGWAGTSVASAASAYSAAGMTGVSAGLTAGSAVGSAAAGVSSAISSALAAIPGWGWVALALLTQFEQSKLTKTGTGLEGKLSGSGASGVTATENYDQDHHGIFGIGAYTTKNVERTAAGSEITNVLTDAVKSITKTNEDYGRILGLNTDKLNDYTMALTVNTTGLDEAGIKTAIAAELTKFSIGQLAFAFGDATQEFARAGETVEQTIQRLIGTQQVREVLNEFGGIFSKIAIAGVDATEAFIGMSGGLDALIKKSVDFVKNYYSTDEQSGMSAKNVLATLNAVDLDVKGVDTKDEFRTLLEGIDVSTVLGLQQVTALLEVQGSFAELVTMMGEQKKDLYGLAELAPEIAALNPLFTASKDATVAAAETTAAAINGTTSAVTAGSDNVVNAVGALGTIVAANGASTVAAIDQMNNRLDALESNNRLAASAP